jgi:hypothetical protein
LLAHDLFQVGDFAKQFNQQSLNLWSAQVREAGWRRNIRKESRRVEPGQAKNAGLPTFLPLLHPEGPTANESEIPSGAGILFASGMKRSQPLEPIGHLRKFATEPNRRRLQVGRVPAGRWRS